MEKYEVSKDWIRENGKKIKEAYLLVTDPKNKCNINSVQDILEIIKIVDPINATKKNAEIFSKILQLFAAQMRDKFTGKPKLNSKTVN